MDAVANRRAVPTAVEATDNRRCPTAEVLGQIHGDLPVERGRLRTAQPSCCGERAETTASMCAKEIRRRESQTMDRSRSGHS